MIKELHLWLNISEDTPHDVIVSVTDMEYIIDDIEDYDIVHTTQPNYFNFIYADRLFAHQDGRCLEIKLGQNETFQRYIKMSTNIVHFILSGEINI